MFKKIRLRKRGEIIQVIDVTDTTDPAVVARRAGELERQHGATDWEYVDEIDKVISTKSKWAHRRIG